MSDNGKPRRSKSSGRDNRSHGKPKERKKTVPAKSLCPHCKVGRLKPKSAYDAAGTVSWKCNKCGRRVKKRRTPKAPEPVVSGAKLIGG
jgi:uncharacterized protein (DUF983 family)